MVEILVRRTCDVAVGGRHARETTKKGRESHVSKGEGGHVGGGAMGMRSKMGGGKSREKRERIGGRKNGNWRSARKERSLGKMLQKTR